MFKNLSEKPFFYPALVLGVCLIFAALVGGIFLSKIKVTQTR
ncbi:MAG: hypothetical protein R3B55_00285 [Candidatus Paceibacterota bacterium]